MFFVLKVEYDEKFVRVENVVLLVLVDEFVYFIVDFLFFVDGYEVK